MKNCYPEYNRKYIARHFDVVSKPLENSSLSVLLDALPPQLKVLGKGLSHNETSRIDERTAGRKSAEARRTRNREVPKEARRKFESRVIKTLKRE